MPPLTLYIDADACPVREECYKVAARHDVSTVVVANSFIRIPQSPLISRQIVDDSFDAADDYIAERADARSVVITSDIPLADRCIKAGAKVLSPNGKPFDENNIGSALATRAIMNDLRAGAEMPTFGGPPPFSQRDRSAFLQALHTVLERMKRELK